MKKYLLDTNICIAILRKDEHVREIISHIDISQCYITAITILELKVGVLLGKAKAKQGKYVDQKLDNFLSYMTILRTSKTSEILKLKIG